MSSYLGNIPSNNFVSLKRQVITGNGGTSYTLDHSVASVNDCAIFVNNVRQNPSSYSISGTALTLGGTISSSDSCYVIFLGQALQTVTPATGTVTNAMIASDAGIATTKLGTGAVLQVVNVQDGDLASGTTTTPYDDTIPQNTEGDEYMTLSITPKSNTSKLKIDVVAHGDASAVGKNTVALFKDSDADALAVGYGSNISGVGAPATMGSFSHYMTSGTTSSITFKVRIGNSNSGTFTFNGTAGGRKYGGTFASSITITEIAV